MVKQRAKKGKKSKKQAKEKTRMQIYKELMKMMVKKCKSESFKKRGNKRMCKKRREFAVAIAKSIKMKAANRKKRRQKSLRLY